MARNLKNAQLGKPIAASAISWSTSAGSISPAGVFTAGTTGGLHTVRAAVGDHEAIAEIRVSTDVRQDGREDKHNKTIPGKQIIRWRGAVPAQKWSNFYMKVLRLFSTSPSLKLEVAFEIDVDRDQAQAKVNEIRSGLMELGLADSGLLS